MPSTLAADKFLQEHLNSSVYLTNNVWKIAFSPCSRYLAIPKQDIYGRYCLLVVRCFDWHNEHRHAEELSVHQQLTCTSAVWSLAFGQRKSRFHSTRLATLLDENLLINSTTPRELLGRRRSSLSVVNRRHDLTKTLFLAAGLADGKINVWNVDTGELTLILKDHQSTVCGLDFTASTMQLASCSHDTTIKLWNLLDDGE